MDGEFANWLMQQGLQYNFMPVYVQHQGTTFQLCPGVAHRYKNGGIAVQHQGNSFQLCPGVAHRYKNGGIAVQHQDATI
jgi:hypothetical protein